MITFLYNIYFEMVPGVHITQDMINRFCDVDLDITIESGDTYKNKGFFVRLERFATIDFPMDEAGMIKLANILFGSEKIQIAAASYNQTSPNKSSVIHGGAFDDSDVLPQDVLGAGDV
jgi:hypothetical protein